VEYGERGEWFRSKGFVFLWARLQIQPIRTLSREHFGKRGAMSHLQVVLACIFIFTNVRLIVGLVSFGIAWLSFEAGRVSRI
jgi:hypothetical protein